MRVSEGPKQKLNKERKPQKPTIIIQATVNRCGGYFHMYSSVHTSVTLLLCALRFALCVCLFVSLFASLRSSLFLVCSCSTFL